MNIYVASSWRNSLQPTIVAALRERGHEVYDFRHPPGGDHLGFSWSAIDPAWERWTVREYMDALRHPVAEAGFMSDFGAMRSADAAVLVLPCGRSAHLEAGWLAGAGRKVWVLLDPREYRTPGGGYGLGVASTELMYLMCDGIFSDSQALLAEVDSHAAAADPPGPGV